MLIVYSGILLTCLAHMYSYKAGGVPEQGYESACTQYPRLQALPKLWKGPKFTRVPANRSGS